MQIKNTQTGDRWITTNIEGKPFLILLDGCDINMFTSILTAIRLSKNINEFKENLNEKTLKSETFKYKIIEGEF